MKKNKVCILGGTGFIGIALIKKLISINVPIKIAYRSEPDLSEFHLLKGMLEFVHINDFFDQSLIDSFIEEDSIVVNLLYIWNQPEKNKRFIKALTNACDRARIKKFIQISTVAVYGRIDVKYVNEDVAPRPFSEYAKTKFNIERLLTEAAKKSSYELIILRPSTVFGDGSSALRKIVTEYQNNKIKYKLKKALFQFRTPNLVALNFVVNAIIFCMFKKSRKHIEIYNLSQDNAPNNTFMFICSVIEKISIRDFPISSNIKSLKAVFNLITFFILYALRRNIVKPYIYFECSAILNEGFSYDNDFSYELSQYINELMNERLNSL